MRRKNFFFAVCLASITSDAPARAECEIWDTVYKSDTDSAESSITITFLPNHSCSATNISTALINGFEENRNIWNYTAKYYCYLGAGGCAISLGHEDASENIITFLLKTDGSPDRMVISRFWKSFYDLGLQPKRLDGRKWEVGEVPAGVADTFSYASCRPEPNITIIDEYKMENVIMKEVTIEYMSSTGIIKEEEVIVNCNEGYKQILIDEVNYSLEESNCNPDEAPESLNLNKVWKLVCK